MQGSTCIGNFCRNQTHDGAQRRRGVPLAPRAHAQLVKNEVTSKKKIYTQMLTSENCDDMMRRSNQSFFYLCIMQCTSCSTKENSSLKTENGTKRAWTRSESCVECRTWPSSLRNKRLKCQARILVRNR